MNIQPAPPAQAKLVAAAAEAASSLPQWEIEANTLNLQGEHRLLHELLRDFHSFNREQCETLRAEGYSSLSDLVNWEYKDIRSLLEKLSNRPAIYGGQQFGDRRIKELQALSWYLTDRRLRGLSFDLSLYRQEARKYIFFAKTDSEIAEDKAADKPDKFKYALWNKWEDSVYKYLDSIIGYSGAPLSYVIRKDLGEGIEWESLDRKTQLIYNARLEGLFFNIDSERVLTLLKELCLGTGAETWFRNIKCGREAMKALQVHYDGPGERERRKEEARSKLRNVYYKHEGTFPFEKFVTNLYDAFQVLEKYGEPVYEREKLRLLFTKSQNAHPEFKLEVNICRSQYSTFTSAVEYLKTVVARLFPDVAKPKSRRNVSSVPSKELNGVDISDLSRWYSSNEIKKLNELQAGRRVLAKIMGNKKRRQKHKDKIDKIKSNKRRRVKSVQVTPAEEGNTLSDKDRRIVAAVINGIRNASKHDALVGRLICTRKQDNTSSESSVTFDYLGNPS